MTTTSDLTVANTIRDQIGHPAFVMMGAKDLAGGSDNLQFKVGANAKKVTHVRVVLDPSDTYTVTFYKCRGASIKELAAQSLVYADQLRKVIETHTGLYLSL